ncbi:MAG: DUF3298 domain-containing protein, partial [Hymenobacter sp.]
MPTFSPLLGAALLVLAGCASSGPAAPTIAATTAAPTAATT